MTGLSAVSEEVTLSGAGILICDVSAVGMQSVQATVFYVAVEEISSDYGIAYAQACKCLSRAATAESGVEQGNEIG